MRERRLTCRLNRKGEGGNVRADMKQADIKFTYHDYLQLPDDKRYELVEGELCLVPSPNLNHQRISRQLEMALWLYVSRQHLGEVFDAPCDVVLSEINVVQPDLLFVSARRRSILTEANVQGAPDLVVEILSPTTGQRDLGIKRNLYAKYGVSEYWIVDPEAQTVEVLLWTETGYRTEAVIQKDGTLNSPLFPSLNLAVTDLF
jgi:Uma2 family endonuclease